MHTSPSPIDPKIPDLAIYEEDGSRIWLPALHFPKRYDARKYCMDEWGCHFLDVRVLKRYMVYEPHIVLNDDDTLAWKEDFWMECEPDEPGAFPVWRCE